MNQRISFVRVIKGLRVNLGEIKDDTRVAGWAEAPEMITNQNFLRIIAGTVVWVWAPGGKSQSQTLSKQTLKTKIIVSLILLHYKHEDISLATL